MNKRLELIDTLHTLSQASLKLASLLQDTALIEDLNKIEILDTIPESNISIDASLYNDWPVAVKILNVSPWENLAQTLTSLLGQNVAGLSILELYNGLGTPISFAYPNCSVEIVARKYEFGINTVPQHVKIVNIDEAHDFDLCIMNEYLEFSSDPTSILTQIKQKMNHNAKILVRARPWTARHGAFIEKATNKAFIHLTMPTTNEVAFKVTKPLATYTKLFNSVGFQELTRKIERTEPEEFFLDSDEMMRAILSRTWTEGVNRGQAQKILQISNINYILIT